MLTNSQISELYRLSSKECWSDSDDFNPAECSGGNYDDAYAGGYDDGETCLARQVLGWIKENAK